MGKRERERERPAATHLDSKHVSILVTQHRVLSNECVAAHPAHAAVVDTRSAARRAAAAPAANTAPLAASAPLPPPAAAAAAATVSLHVDELLEKLAAFDLQELHRREQILNHFVRRCARIGEKTPRGSGGKRDAAAAAARARGAAPAARAGFSRQHIVGGASQIVRRIRMK